MNISYNWLRSLAPTIEASPRELADRLAMLGAPVDELIELSAGLGDVLIARVAAVRPHPNADRLRLCTVDAGTGATLQVVCGAPNVEAGGYYPFAPIGATLPGGLEIKKAKLRGELSEGMLCSARELGLGRDHAGLMALHGEWTPGTSFVAELGLEDTRLLVDVTPNRPDLLSHLGIAREVAPGGIGDIELPALTKAEVELEIQCGEHDSAISGLRVVLEDAIGCPRYTAAIVRGVRVAPSPEWLAGRLRAIGVRPINNVVDATNYVLHEIGQPLHAFDLDRVGGGEIRVRRGRAGESLRTLDGIERSLSEEHLVIADADRAVALAGVMGGEESEVTEATTNLLLECAVFEPGRVRKTARSLGLSTDASYRFERGVDPELQPSALRRLVELITAVAGGAPDPLALDVTAGTYERRVVELRPERVERLLGVELGSAEIASLIAAIGLSSQLTESVLAVEIPGFRPDLTREVDLIEEVARRRGYDSFPEDLRPFRPSAVPEDPLVGESRALRELFSRWGFLESRTAGFSAAAEGRVGLLNPLSAEESHLRDLLLPGLLRRVEHNWAHGVRDVRLFEIGTVFFPGDGAGLPREEIRLAAAFTGLTEPLHWSGASRSWDLWDLKGLLGELARQLGGSVTPSSDSAAGPIESSERFVIAVEGSVLGEGGRVREGSLDAPAWAGPVYGLEVRLAREGARFAAAYSALPEHPSVERDLALIVPDGTSAEEVERVIGLRAGSLLEEVRPFDVYSGPGIPAGTRSVAWRLRFRGPDRTLTDSEVDAAVEKVLSALGAELNVVRR